MIGITGLTLVAALAQATAAPDGVGKIQAYAGTWHTEIQHLDTPFSKASKESKTLKNDCWRSVGFFACDQIVDGDSKALIVFLYNAKNDTYTTYPIPADGGDAGSGKLLIRGNVWTFPWESKDNGKTTYFRVTNTFTSPGTIEFRQEYSEDQQHWTTMATGRETKQP